MEKGTVDMQTSHLLEGVFNTADGVFAVDEGQRIILWMMEIITSPRWSTSSETSPLR
jgi:hypothetical protein